MNSNRSFRVDVIHPTIELEAFLSNYKLISIPKYDVYGTKHPAGTGRGGMR